MWVIAAIVALCAAGWMASCNGNADANKTVAQKDTLTTGKSGYLDAVERYLIDSIGAQYSQGDLCIPCTMLVTSKENADSVLVYGDFWVFNYKIAGDTLKTVSGGSHPGLMCVKKTGEDEFVVTAFDQVEDGQSNEASAKRIFGNLYEDFRAINSNEKRRELIRAKCIAQFLKANKLDYKYYQDYGWPAKKIVISD